MTRKPLLALYSIAHFWVDLSCAFLAFRFLSGSPDFLLCLLLYNFCAFALQMPLGIWADGLNRNGLLAAVGCSLIWRISYPFTRLRLAVFIFVVVGLACAIVLFPEFFSIAALSVPIIASTLVSALVGIVLFFTVARVVDRAAAKRSRSATGFGRGVKMSLGRGSHRVTSTGSSARRGIRTVTSMVSRHREQRDLSRAQVSASKAVKSESDAARRKRQRRVVQSSSGIKVSMGKRSRPASRDDTSQAGR